MSGSSVPSLLVRESARDYLQAHHDPSSGSHLTEPLCEACGKNEARDGDILCPDCSRAFTIVLELLHDHPWLAIDDVERIRGVFEWRMKKTGRAEQKAEIRTVGPLTKVVNRTA